MNPYIAAAGLLLVLGYIAHRWRVSGSFSPPEVLMFVGFTAMLTTMAASAGQEWVQSVAIAGPLAMLVGAIGMKMRPKPDHNRKGTR
ncbi:MAG: hypothetical protein ABIP09_07235 [Gemmatimonadaceae bacterium]